MFRPRIFVALLLTTAAALCAASSAPARASFAARSQQQASEKLYETAKSYYDAGDFQKALEALENLISTDSSYAPARLLKYKALVRLFDSTPPSPPPQTVSRDVRLERRVRLAKLLNEAADSLEKYLQLKPGDSDAQYLRGQLNALRVYAEPAVKPEAEWTVFPQSEVTEKAQILRKREPQYPEEARAARLNGRVKMLAVLADDGTVKDILILQSPSRPLTLSSIEAARSITFKPAVKDGRPVSTSVLLMYNFSTF